MKNNNYFKQNKQGNRGNNANNPNNRYSRDSQPPLNDINTLFKKIHQVCHTKVSNISGALDLLARSLSKPEIPASKVIYLASKLSIYDPDLSLAWVDGVIKHFVVISNSSTEWFASPQSSFFLFAYNASIGTHRETQLRIIADYALSKFIPVTLDQLNDHLRIASVLIQQHRSQNSIFPSGPVFLIQLILAHPETFQFTIPKSLREATIRLLDTLSSNNPVSLILPELCQTIEKDQSTKKIHENANSAANKRIEDFKSQRIYPPMIQMIQPMLMPKQLTEEQKLKKQLKKETRKTKRDIEQARKAIQKDKLQKKKEQKEKKDTERRKVLAMLEGERTYDLNMAAAPAKEDEEEEEKNEEVENLDPNRFDEGLDNFEDDSDDDEDEDEDEDEE